MQNRLKIVFWGTDEFSEIVLEKLLASEDWQVQGVVSVSDKPVGRKKVITPPLIKDVAEKNNLQFWQPEKLNDDFFEKIKQLNLDLNVVASYGKIIPKKFLDVPQFKSLNVHPSLLSKYRGASPIQTVLLNGEQETGVSVMVMDEKMDHGPILVQSEKLKISSQERFSELRDRLAKVGAELLVKAIPEYVAGKIKAQEQNHKQATFCKIIKKQDGEIDWQKPAQEIYNMWRAFEKWPGIFSEKCKVKSEKFLKIKFIKLKNVGTCRDLFNKNLGEVFVSDKRLYVVCGNNSVLEILKLLPEGKKEMEAQAFINGYLR